jgi:8-oxo-dGTP pyrophosphatase MutT (NUDIX family)
MNQKILDMSNPPIPRVRNREAETIFQVSNQRLSRVKVWFEGFTKEYVVAEYGPRVASLVVRGEEVLLVRQYRLLLDDLSWEIPGGAPDEGESLEEAARRECLEESGVLYGKFSKLIKYHPGLDVIANPTTVFYTDDIVEIKTVRPKMDEVVQVSWLPLVQCLKLIRSGEISDALTIIALLSYTELMRGER